MACSDMVIVFSGFRDEALKSQIEAAGGKVAGSLVKNATHVLSKKSGKHGKKLDEAKEKGLEVLDLDEFLGKYDFHLAEKASKAPKASKASVVEAKPSNEDAEDEPEVHEKPSDMELLSIVVKALSCGENKIEAKKALSALASRLS